MKWRTFFAFVCLGVGIAAQGCAQVLGFDEAPDFGVPCTTSADCPGLDDACKTRLCVSGTCDVQFTAAGKLCETSSFCDGAGECKLGPALGCFNHAQCFSGFCVDGVCCDAPCDGTCESCSEPNTKGVCTRFAQGSDPQNECANGVCSGESACEYENGQACSVEKDCISGICFAGSCCLEVCAQGASCDTGACQCPGPKPLICGDVCKDGATDDDNCGECGKTCAIANNEDCLAGICEDFTWARWPIPKDAPVLDDYEVDAVKGVVVDTGTKLMWQRDVDPMPRDWAGAKAYCEQLDLAGFTDWRLPTRIELVSIVDYTKTNPSINTAAFPMDTPSEWFWTSSPWAGSGSAAWIVYFGGGDTDGDGVTYTYRVRCVR